MSFAFGYGPELGRRAHCGPYSNIASDTTDLWFSNRLYKLNGVVVPETTIDGYHTRASARYAQNSAGVWVPYSSGNAAILSDVGYDCREAFTPLNPNVVDPRSMDDGGCTTANRDGSFLGFTSAVDVISAGTVFDRKRDYLSTGLTSGDVQGISAIYEEGTSSGFRISMRNITTAQNAYLDGAHGSLTQSTADAGTFSDIVMTEVQPGIWFVTCVFTATTTGASWSIGAGPNSATTGQYITLAALQVSSKPYPMPFAGGATVSDDMDIPAADAGIDVDMSVSGFAFFWRGKMFETGTAANYRTPVEFLVDGSNRLYVQRNGPSDTYEVAMQRAAGYRTIGFLSSISTYQGVDMTIGATIRADGSWRGKIHTGSIFSGTGETMPAGAISQLSLGQYSTGGTINATCKRAGCIPNSLTDDEFDALFARVAA